MTALSEPSAKTVALYDYSHTSHSAQVMAGAVGCFVYPTQTSSSPSSQEPSSLTKTLLIAQSKLQTLHHFFQKTR